MNGAFIQENTGGATRVLLAVGPPVALFTLVLVLWDVAVRLSGVEPYILPRPGAVLEAAWTHRGPLGRAIALTGAGALCGFGLSLLAGCLIAFLFSQSLLIQRAGYPYAIFLQTVPVVAVAPLIIMWFGYGFQSVVVVGFIIGLFPIITNTTTGLVTVDRNMMELFDVNGATRVQKLLKLRLPNALPYLVAGAKVSSGLCVIGVIVGEFFAGFGQGNFGLGYLILQTSSRLNTAYLFAAILSCTLLGLVIFTTVSLVGNFLLRHRGDSAGH